MSYVGKSNPEELAVCVQSGSIYCVLLFFSTAHKFNIFHIYCTLKGLRNP